MDLFYDTVHGINIRDYSQEQVDAWAPKERDYEHWKERLSSRVTQVAEEDGVIAGFAEFEPSGHIDCFYCRQDFIGHGVGALLFKAIEARAKELGAVKLFAEVSITARPFFEKRGFQIIKEQEVNVRGISMKNYVMEKAISSTAA
jgi:N-acetylglutamate synthase-like GNAT family acetyltransferase